MYTASAYWRGVRGIRSERHSGTYEACLAWLSELIDITDDDFGRYGSRSGAHAAAKRLQAEHGGYPS